MADKTLPSSEGGDVAFYLRVRYLVVFVLFLGVVSAFSMRTTLALAIVAMTNPNKGVEIEHPKYDWSPSIRGATISSFFWGVVASSIPSGMLIQKYGARIVLTISIFVCGLVTTLIPTAVFYCEWKGLLVCRIVQGLCQGPVFPAINSITARWALPSERGTMGCIAYAGMQGGNIIVFAIGGILAASKGGWPQIFHVFGLGGALWSICWFLIVRDTPIVHKFIKEKEKEHIVSFYENNVAASFAIPWRAIATAKPVWAVTLSYCVQYWGFYLIVMEIPTYLFAVLRYEMEHNGLLSSLPYVVMLICIFVFASIADFLTVKKKVISLTTSRKIFTALGFIGPMLALFTLTLIDETNRFLAVSLIVLCTGLNAGVYVGFVVNHVDLAPNFAGFLMGVSNTFANIMSITVTTSVGLIIKDKKNVSQWNTVFYITACFYLFGAIIYCVFGTTERQPWNDPPPPEEPGPPPAPSTLPPPGKK